MHSCFHALGTDLMEGAGILSFPLAAHIRRNVSCVLGAHPWQPWDSVDIKLPRYGGETICVQHFKNYNHTWRRIWQSTQRERIQCTIFHLLFGWMGSAAVVHTLSLELAERVFF